MALYDYVRDVPYSLKMKKTEAKKTNKKTAAAAEAETASKDKPIILIPDKRPKISERARKTEEGKCGTVYVRYGRQVQQTGHQPV